MKLGTSRKNGKKIICFSRNELSDLYRITKLPEMVNVITSSGLSIKDDFLKMQEIALEMGEKNAQHRDEHEIFASLYMIPDFFDTNSEICYELEETFDPKKHKIFTLDDLYKFRKTNSDSDFLIKTKDGMMSFQLKRYRKEFDVQSLFKYIVDTIKHYGNNLGETNLLVILQPKKGTSHRLEFRKLYELIKAKKYKFDSSILFSFNENNQRLVLVSVYPNLKQMKIPLREPSTRQF